MAERRQVSTAVRHSIPPARTPSTRSQRSIVSRNSVDIFSDEFSLERLQSADSSRAVSPIESNESIEAPSTSQSRLIHSSVQPSLEETPVMPRNSISKRGLAQRYAPTSSQPTRGQSTASRASMARTTSTASRLSMPRAPSPYNGATGPSHPYAMYPQITRTSSASTVRPAEEEFVNPRGPEYPYAMYPQNTVPEEDAEPVVPTSMIPVGFPGMSRGFQRRVDQQGEDVGDIIGPDGHMEQLPPYSRYPDEIASKQPTPQQSEPTSPVPPGTSGTMATIHSEAALSQATTEHEPVLMSDRSTVSGGSSSGSSLGEKLRRNGRRRICCGLPLWLVLGVTGVIILAATIGAVIGGVVANQHHKGPPRDPAPDSAGSPTTTVTATSFIDATPLPSGTQLPAVPQGDFNVPTNQIKSSSATCVVDPTLTQAWACLPPYGLGVNVSSAPVPNSAYRSHSAQFQPYPLTPNFTYGAQLPDFGNQVFSLTPNLDKDQPNLGPALFFFTQYDKLNILPEKALTPGSKRTVDAEIVERQFEGGGNVAGGFSHRKETADPGERPWFCYWNQTLFEFFIYVNETVTDAPPQNNGSNSSDDGSAPSSAAASTTPTSVPTSTWSSTPALAPVITGTGTPIYASNAHPEITASAIPSLNIEKRDGGNGGNGGDGGNGGGHGQTNDFPLYPRFVKIVEKRKPTNSIQPYCQQMVVNNDGTWQPAEGVPHLTITESEPAATPAATSAAAAATSGASSAKFRIRDLISSEEDFDKRQISGITDSNCACEWLST